MTNSVIISHSFKREVKPLAKKYHTLKESVDKLIAGLIIDPYLGESYGKGIYKIRLADESKGKGKSGGFRVMYYHLNISKDGIEVLLMTIFNKSDQATIKKAIADKILKEIIAEHEREKHDNK